ASKSLAVLRGQLNEARSVLRAGRAVLDLPDWSLLLALVGSLRGTDVVLDRCELDRPAGRASLVTAAAAVAPPTDSSGPSLLRLQGHGRSQAAVSQFALRLERTDLFDNVAWLKTAREPFLGGDAVAFRLECQLKTGAADAKAPRAMATVG